MIMPIAYEGITGAKTASVAMKTVRVVIADGQTMFREGMKALLTAEQKFAVVGEAADGKAALELVSQVKPDLLLMDLELAGLDAMGVLAELALVKSGTRTLILTSAISRTDYLRALQLGACGIVLKSSPAKVLVESLLCIKAGEYWIGNDGVANLVQAVKELTQKADKPNHGSKFGVTARELEIIDAIVAGYSNSEIANKLSLSQQTVKHHLSNIFDKLGVFNRLELALFAINHRLVE